MSKILVVSGKKPQSTYNENVIIVKPSKEDNFISLIETEAVVNEYICVQLQLKTIPTATNVKIAITKGGEVVREETHSLQPNRPHHLTIFAFETSTTRVVSEISVLLSASSALQIGAEDVILTTK